VIDGFDEELRLAVYGALAATGTVPTDEQLAGRLGTDVAAVREPVAAADYFRSVGLTGPFWGG